MNNELAQSTLLEFPPEKIKLLKNTICRGASDVELELFMNICITSGLNPFLKQIYSIRRKSKDKSGNWVETQTIQTSIDGLRIIAESTKNYSPGREPTFCYDDNKNLISATCFIKKRTEDGTWHDVSATCFLSEYKPQFGSFWDKMPHVMLAKCAEAAALRKAFPMKMSGVYTDDEMAQARRPEEAKEEEQKVIEIDPQVLEEQRKSMKKTFESYAQFFDECDQELIVQYLFAYAERRNKTADETCERFKDDKEFLQFFNVWKSKQVSNESGT